MSSSSGRGVPNRARAHVSRGVGHGLIGLVLWVLLGTPSARAEDAVRPELGKPLLAAQELVKAQRYREALARLREADAIGGKSAYESFMVERMRIAAAAGAGEVQTAARAYDTMAGLNRLSSADKATMLESIAGGYYRAREYPAAIEWAQRYFREGGSSSAMRTLLIQSQYLGGDLAGAVKELTIEVRAAERGGAVVDEDRLRLLLAAAAKIDDSIAQGFALERLVAHHPRPEYWADLLGRVQRKPGFSSRLALDAFRLALAVGSLTTADDYMELAQLALQAELPTESRQVLAKGFATRVLGTGPQAPRHRRLLDLVELRVAEHRRTAAERERVAIATRDGHALVAHGWALVHDGQAARGVQLIQQGIAQGGLKRADDARLHLGVAQLMAGDAAQAAATLGRVTGADGTGDLARLWSLHARRQS